MKSNAQTAQLASLFNPKSMQVNILKGHLCPLAPLRYYNTLEHLYNILHMLYNENICHKIQASADHNLHYYSNYCDSN